MRLCVHLPEQNLIGLKFSLKSLAAFHLCVWLFSKGEKWTLCCVVVCCVVRLTLTCVCMVEFE